MLRTPDRYARLTDDALLAAVTLGNTDATAVFIRRFQSRVYRLFMGSLQDAHVLSPSRPGRTWPSFLPLFRYDHVFVCPRIRVRDMKIPRTPLTKVASDHLPVVLDFDVIPESSVTAAIPG